MVGHGYDVYLLDWGVPGLEDKDLKFDDYTLDYMPRAIRKMKSISNCSEFSLLGWCIGAILTTIYAALRPDDGLRNLLLLTAPLDFSNRERLTFARWTDEKYFDVDKLVAAFGNVPGEMIDYGAKALKPVENYIGNYLKLWDNIDNPRVVESWHAMNTWVTDNIPMAGAAYRQLIVDLYRNDRLMQGTLSIRGEHCGSETGRAPTCSLSLLRATTLRRRASRKRSFPKVGSTDTEYTASPEVTLASWREAAHTNKPGPISIVGLLPVQNNTGTCGYM